jgi:glutamine amidotransferase
LRRVVVLDCGGGNLRSVCKAFEAVGVTPELTRDHAAVEAASHLVLPGVGAFGDFMQAMERFGFEAVLRRRVEAGVPLLGICVGMQVLYERGEEFGEHRGLGLLKGRVARFDDTALVVPHTGWNRVRPVALDDGRLADPVFSGHPSGDWFYFVHGYRAVDVDAAEVSAWCEYGGGFPAACRKGNVRGVQFHPEKSQKAGLSVLRAFVEQSP